MSTDRHGPVLCFCEFQRDHPNFVRDPGFFVGSNKLAGLREDRRLPETRFFIALHWKPKREVRVHGLTRQFACVKDLGLRMYRLQW